MKVYKVGGCVRDLLLGLTPSDYDYVVVGSSHEEMISLGYNQVGKDFPVYLHPETNEEYALARQERKTSTGYNGFKCLTENVTLEDDLLRRDLTINAIAMDSDGKLIDPFGGCSDLASCILRPVSDAFSEDPLRVLRIARLRSKLGGEWKISESAIKCSMDLRSELYSLSKERVYLELKKALKTPKPSVFFRSLLDLGVLDIMFPELYDMVSCQHDNPYHMEGSVFNHTMMVVDLLKTWGQDDDALIAALFHDVGKVPCKLEYGTFHGHSDEKYVEPAFEKIKLNYRLSKSEFMVAKYVALNHHRWQSIIDGNTKHKKITDAILSVRDFGTMMSILKAVYADMEGRIGIKKKFVHSMTNIIELWYTVHKHKTDCTDLNVEQIKNKVRWERVSLVKNFLHNLKEEKLS